MGIHTFVHFKKNDGVHVNWKFSQLKFFTQLY